MRNIDNWVFRCGQIFCKGCLCFELRLDSDAEPSPDGSLSKVFFLL